MKTDRIKMYQELENKVGNTPLYRLQNIDVPNNNKIFAKEEQLNPTASGFDRVYPFLFRVAEEEGLIVPRITPVIEATTGNAGASFAWCAQELGYNDCSVIIHEDAPKSRIKQIQSYGAKVIFSPVGQYTKGYVRLLEEILREDKRKKGGKLGENPERMYCVTKINPRAREPYRRLVDETFEQLGDETIDYFVGIVGSGTNISGIGKRLKERNSNAKVIAFDPAETPSTYVFKYGHGTVLDFNKMPHEVFGGATFGLPLGKLNIDIDIIDDVKLVTKDEWQEGCKMLEELEKKSVGRSSGGALAVSLKLAKEIEGKNILICFYDAKWKYEDKYPHLK